MIQFLKHCASSEFNCFSRIERFIISQNCDYLLKAMEWQKEERIQTANIKAGSPRIIPTRLASTRHPASHHALLDLVDGGLLEPHTYVASHIFVLDALQSSEQNAIGQSLT
jgi:hypothetical protein